MVKSPMSPLARNNINTRSKSRSRSVENYDDGNDNDNASYDNIKRSRSKTKDNKDKLHSNSASRAKKREIGNVKIDNDENHHDRLKLKESFKIELNNMYLFKSPISVILLFSKIMYKQTKFSIHYLLTHVYVLVLILLSIISYIIAMFFHSHDVILSNIEDYFMFIVTYVGLGILSSIGLGSGLHTFVLYIGPHIAQVTMAATMCNTLNFELYGNDAYACDENLNNEPIHMFDIFMLVQMVVLLWGIGTAIGELPPYFMSRAAARAGKINSEIDELQADDNSYVGRLKKSMYINLQKYGFWAILLFASVPNPLFDLAGVTCGQFDVPFWTFFGATAIGKAVIKAHLQAFVVIFIFHQTSHIENFIKFIISITPSAYHDFVETKLLFAVDAMIHTYTKKHDDSAATGGFRLGMLWEAFLAFMFVYFLISIIDSTVQSAIKEKHGKLLAKYEKSEELK